MKKFQKINDELFKPFPEGKIGRICGGANTSHSITYYASTGSQEMIDAMDIDQPR